MKKLLVFLMLIMCFGLFADFIEVGGGTAITSYVPVYGYYDYSWSRVIYTAEELANQSFNVTGLEYQFARATDDYEMLNQSIYIQHTSLDNFPMPNYEDPITNGAVKVYDGSITFTGNVGDWFTLDFNVNDFAYNGTDNIIIYWENRDGSYTSGYPRWYYKSDPNRCVYKYKDDSFPLISGSLNMYKPNTRFLTEDSLALPESVDIPAGNTDIYETIGSLIEIAFTENDHPDINISIMLNEIAPSVVGDLPETISSLLPVYWTINTVTGQGHNYTITFDLATIEDYNGDIEYRILKRSDSSQVWFDVTSIPGVALSYNGSKVTVTGLNTFSEFSAGIPSETLPVELSSFSATITAENYAQINWETASESNLLGYNIYRNENEDSQTAQRLNPEIITAHNTANGANYSYLDQEVDNQTTYYYWLESLELSNENTLYGPVTVKIESQENNNVLPTATNLSSAYPNPFNPQTTIKFSVKESDTAQLIIYNLKGQIIKTYPKFLPGQHVIVWNAKDNNNKDVTSGVYLYKLISHSYSKTNKMILMK